MTTKPASYNIQFHFLEGGEFRFSKRILLKAFISQLFCKEKMALQELNYIFCSDDYLLEINRQYLRHDYYTDIITFGLNQPKEPINAEIYISVERVKENARQFETSFQTEMHRVIFHGALHLCGYKDKSKQDSLLMRKMEDKYLKLYLES